jgi:hypothetical protein
VTNVLHAGGYGRVGATVQIKAVLLWNRYVKILAHLTGRNEALKGDNLASFVLSQRPSSGKSLLTLLTDQ